MESRMKIVEVSVNEKENSKKWGAKAMSLGYTQIPSLFIQRQRELGLDPIDFNIVVQLLSYWWRNNELPFPSKRVLADALNVDVSTIRRRMAALEKAGILVRKPQKNPVKGQISNRYDLSGLVTKFQPIVDREAEQRLAKQTKKGRTTIKVVAQAPLQEAANV